MRATRVCMPYRFRADERSVSYLLRKRINDRECSSKEIRLNDQFCQA
jgi:hypothetical protein